MAAREGGFVRSARYKQSRQRLPFRLGRTESRTVALRCIQVRKRRFHSAHRARSHRGVPLQYHSRHRQFCQDSSRSVRFGDAASLGQRRSLHPVCGHLAQRLLLTPSMFEERNRIRYIRSDIAFDLHRYSYPPTASEPHSPSRPNGRAAWENAEGMRRPARSRCIDMQIAAGVP